MEKWKDIEGFEGYYQVSDHGRVRSLDRVVIRSDGKPQPCKGQIIIPKSISKHREYFDVCLSKKGIRTNNYVHILVAKAFVPNSNPNTNKYVLHKIPDKTNNYASNLKWGTSSENNHQRVSDGNDWESKKTHCPLGAPLDFLVPSGVKRKKRDCQACMLTRSYLRRHDVDKQKLHDLMYEYKCGTRGLKKLNLLENLGVS